MKGVKGFQKGDPNINREGKPKGAISLLAILKRKLEECPEGEDKKTYAEKIVQHYLNEVLGLKPDNNLLKDIFNRIDGMPTESIKHSGSIRTIADLINEEDEDEQTTDIETENPAIS